MTGEPKQDIIADEESVARLIHQEWIVDGQLQQTAFQLRNEETYLSVNRPAIESYLSDVTTFVTQHPKYRTAPLANTYHRALLNVAEVRGIAIDSLDQVLNVSVEVEPRSAHTKSHAGIFARVEGQNIKGGKDVMTLTNRNTAVSTLQIHQKLRWNLLRLAQLETCELEHLTEPQEIKIG